MISKYIKEFSESLRHPKKGQNDNLEGGSVVIAHELTRKAAALYEKIRGFVDYQEENQIKRRVIERIIKRKLLFRGQVSIGRSIIEELVGAGYLPNNSIPETKALEVQHIVDYYKSLASFNTLDKDYLAFSISMASVEVHQLLFDNSFDVASVNMFISILRDNLKSDLHLSEERKEKLSIISTHRVLLESSREEIFYALFQFEHIERKRRGDHTDTTLYAYDFYQRTKELLEDPLIWTISNKIKDLGVSIKLIKEITKEYKGAEDEIFENKPEIAEKMSQFLESTYKKEKEYVQKNGVRAVIYLLCTKIVLALIIEVPLDLWLLGEIAFFSLAINIIFHPLLLLSITRRSLGFTTTNTNKVVNKALGIIDGNIEPINIKTKTKSRYEIAYFFLYGLLYAVTFSIIVGVLLFLRFNVISILLFLVFLALVSYFGMRIRGHALKYKVETGEEKIMSTLGNLFMFPVVRLGRYLSIKFSTINAIVFIMDFIIETPLKLLLKIFNDFLYFLRDKREDVF